MRKERKRRKSIELTSIPETSVPSSPAVKPVKHNSLPPSPQAAPPHHLPPNYEKEATYQSPHDVSPKNVTLDVRESVSHIIVKHQVPVITDVEVLLQINEGITSCLLSYQ